MGAWQRGLAWTLAAFATLGVGALSQVPYEADSMDEAVVRAAWRFRGARVDECRTLTPAQQAELPAHMRRERVCDTRVIPYRLTVRIDGVLVVDDTARAGGAHEDRPLYVSRDVVVVPGTHAVAIGFERLEELTGDAAAAVPAALEFAAHLELAPKQVALITYDPATQRLVHRGYGRDRP